MINRSASNQAADAATPFESLLNAGNADAQAAQQQEAQRSQQAQQAPPPQPSQSPPSPPSPPSQPSQPSQPDASSHAVGPGQASHPDASARSTQAAGPQGQPAQSQLASAPDSGQQNASVAISGQAATTLTTPTVLPSGQATSASSAAGQSAQTTSDASKTATSDPTATGGNGKTDKTKQINPDDAGAALAGAVSAPVAQAAPNGTQVIAVVLPVTTLHAAAPPPTPTSTPGIIAAAPPSSQPPTSAPNPALGTEAALAATIAGNPGSVTGAPALAGTPPKSAGPAPKADASAPAATPASLASSASLAAPSGTAEAQSGSPATSAGTPADRAASTVLQVSTTADRADATSSAAAPKGPIVIAPTGDPSAAAAAMMPAPTMWVAAPTTNAASSPDDTVPIAGLAVAIASRSRDGTKSFAIRLDPPELGRIDVQLSVDSNGRATTHLTADRPETLDLLKQDAPALQRALESAGLKTDSGGLEFSLRNQSFGGGQSSNNPATPVARIIVPDATLPPVETAARGYGRLSGPGGGVDIRV